ncbi:MAG: hypothetical protein LBS84_06540 [Clostridiales bacterium]|jgi:hypothetical protein|nr:hypothetical protein [Clostridiales bacterium]
METVTERYLKWGDEIVGEISGAGEVFFSVPELIDGCPRQNPAYSPGHYSGD